MKPILEYLFSKKSDLDKLSDQDIDLEKLKTGYFEITDLPRKFQGLLSKLTSNQKERWMYILRSIFRIPVGGQYVYAEAVDKWYEILKESFKTTEQDGLIAFYYGGLEEYLDADTVNVFLKESPRTLAKITHDALHYKDDFPKDYIRQVISQIDKQIKIGYKYFIL